MTLTLTAVNRYPIKSCRGHTVDHALVERWGLAGDRRWMLVDEQGDAVTARKHPQLVLVTPEIDADGLLVRAPKLDPLPVRTPMPVERCDVQVFSSQLAASPAAKEAHAWFSTVVGKPVRLVVAGAPAWAEDGWRVLRIGATRFRAVKGCDRCVLTTIDPGTAKKGKEPIATLARHRRWDGKVWFAINLIPDSPGASVHVGDEVEIVMQVATTEPLR